MANTPANGVKIRLVSRQMLDSMPTAEKIRFILDEVEAGRVLVLERGLLPTEEAQLIEATMAEIQQDGFTGIEMQSYGHGPPKKFAKLLRVGRKSQSRMTVVGPANRVVDIAKDAMSVSALLVASGA